MEHLGCDVLDRSNQGVRTSVVVVQVLRQAKVGNLCVATRVKQDIRGLQVAVNRIRVMQVLQAKQYLGRQYTR